MAEDNMINPQEYIDRYKSMEHEVYQSIVALMKEKRVTDVDLSENEDGETYRDEGWYNTECIYLTNFSDERRYYIVKVELSNDSLFFTYWDEENNVTFQDPQWDSQHIQLVDLVYIYWNLHLLLVVFPAEKQKEQNE